MVISQPPGNNPSYYYRASPTLPQLLWMLPETPYVLYMQLQHQGNSWNIAIKHIFYTNQIHGGIISRLFFIHFVAPCACSSPWNKYYFKSFCMKIWARWPYIHLSVVFPSRMPAGPHFVTQPILLVKTFLIFDINLCQNTRRSDQIETIKTIMQTTRPRITWVLPMAQFAILKNIDQWKI